MKNLTLLPMALLLALLPDCSKENSVSVQNGNLPSGSECALQPEDPCAGACIGSVCRASCGSNRECPSNEVCTGDGEQSGCVPAGYGHLNLLTDCAEGCTPELAPFDREGRFYMCESEYGSLPSSDGSTRPDLDVRVLCTSAIHRGYSVKNGSGCSGGVPEYWGIAGDRLVANRCGQGWQWGFLNTVDLGWLYNVNGETYLLKNYTLMKFVPESVPDQECPPAPADQCPAPSYPEIGAIPSEFVGFWAECEPISKGEGVYPDYDIDDCLTQVWGERNWVWNDGGIKALAVRPDGYGHELPATFGLNECTTAFRYTGANSEDVMQMSFSHNSLSAFSNRWVYSEQGGENFLRIIEKSANPESGPLMRRIPTPPEFAYDPCDDEQPVIGF